MARSKSREDAPEDSASDTRSRVDRWVKTAIERGLAEDHIPSPETGLGFDRFFDSQPPNFGRLFSRGGGTHLEEITVEALATMEDDAFAKFTERLQVLQDLAFPEDAGRTR